MVNDGRPLGIGSCGTVQHQRLRRRKTTYSSTPPPTGTVLRTTSLSMVSWFTPCTIVIHYAAFGSDVSFGKRREETRNGGEQDQAHRSECGGVRRCDHGRGQARR